MQGPLAACVYGVAALRAGLNAGRVVVSASVAEEVVEGAALIAVCERVLPDYVVICEATGLHVATGHRGRAEVMVEVEGRPSHSAWPELGINAAEAMADAVHALRRIELPHHDQLGDALLVLTDIISQPYPGRSVVPERCRATYDRRTVPGETEADVLGPVREALRVTAGKATAKITADRVRTWTGAWIEAQRFAAAWDVDEGAPIVQSALAALREIALPARTSHWAFCTNGSGSAGRLGIPTIGYGPGDEQQAHCVDEHIELDQLSQGADGYAAITAGLLAPGDGS